MFQFPGLPAMAAQLHADVHVPYVKARRCFFVAVYAMAPRQGLVHIRTFVCRQTHPPQWRKIGGAAHEWSKAFEGAVVEVSKGCCCIIMPARLPACLHAT